MEPVWQAGYLRIRKQLSPTLEVEGGLVFGGAQLARQRHYREVDSKSVRIRGVCDHERCLTGLVR